MSPADGRYLPLPCGSITRQKPAFYMPANEPVQVKMGSSDFATTSAKPSASSCFRRWRWVLRIGG
jgi:hypothetical protein